MERVHAFNSANEWESWLSKNHSRSDGIWLRIYKKSAGANALKSTEVLDPLLCYGWITGQARRGTDKFVLWWVCPRRKNSLWSEVNKSHVERLIKEGRMKPSGMREVEEAKKDGRWDKAYPPQRTATLPSDFMKKVSRNKRARAFLKTLNRANTYAIIFRLHNTRDRKKRLEKMDKIIKMLEDGKAFH
jgi:uncharacterized protein YdeI (YjbR/CyaY-like superfamily)